MASDWRQQQKEALRQRLFETALERFQADGYEQTTVQQITEQVGVAKGTFFNHFQTKEHVVAEWYDGLTFRSLEAARERETASAADAIRELCVDMARRAMASPELLFAKARHSANPLLVEAERTQDDEIDAFILDLCRQGRASGELSSTIDETFLVGLIGSVLTGTSREWVARAADFDFAAVVDERLRFVLAAATAHTNATTASE